MDARFLIAVSLFLIIPVCGCNSGSEEENAGQPKNAGERLAGTWYGRARLNADKLQAHLDSIIDPAEREKQAAIVQGFLTTEMAARFDASGSMELDMQMQPPGQSVMRDSTTGKWSVLESSANEVLIETVEQLPTGGTETSQVRYQFQQNDNIVVMKPPTYPWLAACDPVFVFDRIEGPAANVASQPGNNRSVK